ncbi:MAG TPA: ribonuclease D [Steroidobacteraceae bacterium]|nr:ribonuclease D [Steroidobacteraceae bacterium]
MALVSTAEALGALVDSWPAGTPLALDTEFVRERTYYPRLCLVQVATPDGIALIDALALGAGSALAAPLLDGARLKQAHAARQDIEALLPLTGRPAGPVFDTQQAAALLGFPAQVGYGELVRQLLGVGLAKGHARTDWARRPLSAEQLAYAEDDVRYLPALAESLDQRLAAAGRRGWMQAESESLGDLSLYRVDPAQAWRRLKGTERMDRAALRAAAALARWREERAMARDLPRGWVLPDAAIHALAQARPRTREALARIDSVPPGTAARAAEDILAAIRDAPELGDVADAGQESPPGPGQLRQLKHLQQKLQAIAGELRIQPEVLATRRELTAMVRGARELPVLSGWRREVIGEPLLAAL